MKAKNMLFYSSAIMISFLLTIFFIGCKQDRSLEEFRNTDETRSTEQITSKSIPSISATNSKKGTDPTIHTISASSNSLLVVTTANNTSNKPYDCKITSTPALSWVKSVDAGASNSNNAEIWTAKVSTGGMYTIKSDWGSSISQASVVYVFANAAAVGTTATATSQSLPSVTIKTTNTNSVVIGVTVDRNGVSGTRKLRDGTETYYWRDANRKCSYYFYKKEANQAGTYTLGLSSPSGQAASTALLEIKSVGDGSIVVNPPASGNPSTGYLSLPLTQAVVYNNQNNIIIENKRFFDAPGDILKFNNCSNVTIRNCYFGKSVGEAISIYKGSNITIEKCLFANNRTGVYAVETTGGIKVLNNQFINVKGPMPRGQYVQFNTVTGANNLVEGNKGECFEGESKPEDLISVFSSKGTSASPITIKNNVFRGGGPSGSGGGIMAGDYNGQYILVEDNILVNPGQYGLAISGGRNIVVRNNKVFASQKSWNNIGMYIWAQAGASCGDISVSGNKINYTNSSGKRNDYWNAGNCNVCSCSGPTSITLSEISVPTHLIDFLTPADLLLVRQKAK